MAISVYQTNNPGPSLVGTLSTDATTIVSGFTSGVVEYQVARRESAVPMMSFISSVQYNSRNKHTPQVVSISATQLIVLLPLRSKLKCRVRQSNSVWSAWYKFNTKDKRYQSPDEITQLTDNSEYFATQRGKLTIVVTNHAKAVVTQNGHLVTVDGGTTITSTGNGATVADHSSHSHDTASPDNEDY